MFSEPIIKQTSNGNYQLSFGDDRGLYAEFFNDAILDHYQTQQQGRPIYRSVDMLRIMFPGDNTKEVVRIVRMQQEGNQPADPDRFPHQWAAYQAKETQAQDGTPIEHWPPINKAQVMELKSLKIYTVEQLAAVSDNNLNWMGARQLRDNAKAWLDEAIAGAETMKLRGEVEELRAQLTAMANQNAGFSASKTPEPVLESPEAAPILEAPEIKPIAAKMRGRPKKVANGTDIPSVDAAGGQ